ncbi:group III truncated hemoglobin [Marinoscillum sp. MHG1-6]|uniref:group III truncated hemoglobin n=1 Tax=Marinoscillum sp. MHG1-6 TaxID=2959627 RepID=UPI0021573248|nr:group III truncated hemoglobin [Marinoscillum sp. MHG1-6]
MSKKDIQSRADIQLMVDEFYKKVIADELIGHFFNNVVKLDWEKHIPIMYDFWESMLLQKNVYRGNPMQAHLDLNSKSPLKEKHFNRWLNLFEATVDELFIGQNADTAKTRALSIATIIQAKLMTQNPEQI